MPGTHSPISRHLFTLDGNVLTTGGAKNLAKGQFTIVDSATGSLNGALVVSNFAGKSANTVYEMRLGKHKIPNNRTAANSKPYSSELFTIKDVVSVKANFPRVSVQKFDSLLIGYDGINDDTQIELEEGQTTALDITLSGDPVGFSTNECSYVVKMHFGREKGQTLQEVFQDAADRLRKQTLPMGVPITDLIDIDVVDSENEPLAGTPYVFSTLTLQDEGTSNDLARVQAQYPLYDVIRTGLDGITSVYTILHPQASALATYKTTVASYVKGCEDCGVGYSELEGGIIYSITLEDDGTDQTALIDDVPGFVTGTVVKKGNSFGKGTYTVVVDNALTEAEIAAYVAVAGIKATAEFTLIGDVKDLCTNATITETAWVDGDVCYASVEQYKIQLKDDDCDGSRLAELQAAYPNLVIEAGAPTGSASQAVTLTGTSGTANVVIAGVNYLATFATDLATTAANFVTAHAAAILAATGAVVTSNAAVITITDSAEGFPSVSVANVSGNLAGTAAAVDYVVTATTGGCQTVYSTSVITDIVCEECSDIFLDQFQSEAPQDFDFTSWEKIESAFSETAKMGIRLTGKPFIWYPGENMRDEVPFYETSTRIMAAGGYIEQVSESFVEFYDYFNVKRLSRAQDRDNLGGHLMQWEDVSRTYFDGETRHVGNLYAKAILGEESVLKYSEQYVSYEITILDTKYSQGVGSRSNQSVTYTIWAPVGKRTALEAYVNSVAVAANLPAINAIAV